MTRSHTHLRAILLFVSLLGLLAVANADPAAAAGSQPQVGVQFHGTWSDYTPAQRALVLDKLAASGAGWVRVDVGWASLREAGPNVTSDWYVERVDDVVDAARKRGLKVLATLWGTPSWANGARGTNVPPSDPRQYAAVAGWAARHFRGRVAAWEVWNEPNLDGFWAGSVTDYARLLELAYPQLKTGDPQALVVGGSVSYNDVGWLRKLYAAGGGDSFDVLSTHPYQGIADAPPDTADDGTRGSLAHVSAVRDLMVRHGDGAKPIWFTEFGWSTHPNSVGVENRNRGVTAEEQAAYLIRTLELVAERYPYVTHLFWYRERDGDEGSAQLRNYGLLERDLGEKPAYRALKLYLTTGKTPVRSAGSPAVAPVRSAKLAVSFVGSSWSIGRAEKGSFAVRVPTARPLSLSLSGLPRGASYRFVSVGRSATRHLHVVIPRPVRPGSYLLRLLARRGSFSGRASVTLRVT